MNEGAGGIETDDFGWIWDHRGTGGGKLT
jgi:hypothetical protein